MKKAEEEEEEEEERYAELLLRLLELRHRHRRAALLHRASLLHHAIACRGLLRRTLLLNLLIRIYGACCRLPSAALSLFARHPNPNQHSWNFLLAGLSGCDPVAALQLFRDMENRACILPNRFIFATVLSLPPNGEEEESALRLARCIHARACAMACDGDAAVGTSLVTTYARHLLLGHARSAFEQILHPNAHSWSALISALAAPGGHHAELAASMLARMREQGSIPNKVSFLSLLRACDRDRPPRCYVTAAHLAILANGFESDPIVATSLIDAKSRCGKLGEVSAIFDGICSLDEQAWNAMISAHTLHHHTREALQLYNQMLQQGSMPNGFIAASILSACASPDRRCDGKRIHAFCIASEFKEDDVVRNALVNMHGKSGDLELARCMFEQVREPDKYLWTSMIVMLCENDEGQEALRVFARLQGHVKPDNITFSSILSACANEAMLSQGKVIHARTIEEEAKVVLAVGNALLNMYSKGGSLQDAENVFLGMGSKDTVSWNAMITAYSHHGHFKASIDLFDVMKEQGLCSPNEVTFVAILSACSHGGMVDKGSCYFTSMTKDHGMEPLEEHYNCMIDLFARAGLLEDAENLISKMPMEASAVSWLTLLSACKCEADLGRGIAYANKLFQLESDSSAPYFMLADLHYRIGMEDEAVKVLHALNTKDSKEALVDW